MAYLDDLITILRDESVFQIYLPFLLTFSIFYAAIRKMNIFGKDSSDTTANKISIVIALVAALFVTIYTPVGGELSIFFAKFFAISSIWMVAIMVFMMMFGLFLFLDQQTMRNQFIGQIQKIGIITVVLVGLTWLLSGGIGLFTELEIPYFGIDMDDLILILILVGTGVVIFLVQREDKSSGKPPSGGGDQKVSE